MAQQSLSLANLQTALTQNNTKMKEWVNSQIGDIELFSIQWVQELPTGEDISTATIYMIKNEAEEGQNVYTEYVYNNDAQAWEVLGELHAEVDLSIFYTKEEMDTTLALYFTKTEINSLLEGTLADYYTSAEVDSKLADYYTSTEVENKLADYYLKSEMDNTLAEFVTREEIGNTLTQYYQKTEIDNTLLDYYTKSDANAQFDSKEEVNAKLENYYTKTEMDDQIAALAVNGYEETEVTSMVDGLWS